MYTGTGMTIYVVSVREYLTIVLISMSNTSHGFSAVGSLVKLLKFLLSPLSKNLQRNSFQFIDLCDLCKYLTHNI